MRKRERGVQWIADHVRKPAVAFEPLCKLGRALRMDEERRAQLLGLCPDRVKPRVGEPHARYAAADSRTLQAELLYALLELLHREIGILQRQRGERGETI